MSDADPEPLSRGVSREMSPEAIARRLDIASQLYRLAKTLSDAEYVGPASRGHQSEEVRERPPEDPKE